MSILCICEYKNAECKFKFTVITTNSGRPHVFNCTGGLRYVQSFQQFCVNAIETFSFSGTYPPNQPCLLICEFLSFAYNEGNMYFALSAFIAGMARGTHAALQLVFEALFVIWKNNVFGILRPIWTKIIFKRTSFILLCRNCNFQISFIKQCDPR